MIMKSVELNEETRQFRAVDVEVQVDMANESQGEKHSADVIGDASEATSFVPSEKLGSSTSKASVADKQRSTAVEILYARSIEGEIDHEKLTREIIARFPKILAELAK
jgi:hypothetical protein